MKDDIMLTFLYFIARYPQKYKAGGLGVKNILHIQIIFFTNYNKVNTSFYDGFC